MDALWAFLGALIGGVAASVVNWFLLDKQHRHAIDLQERQWKRTERDREHEHRLRRGDQIAEWDHARQERRSDRRIEINRDRANRQREAIYETQSVVASLVNIARALYGERMEAYRNVSPEQLRADAVPQTESMRVNGRTFNETRDRLKFVRSRVDDENICRLTRDIEHLAVDMATIPPKRWEMGPVGIAGERDPTFLIVDWRDQFYDMTAASLTELQRLETAEVTDERTTED